MRSLGYYGLWPTLDWTSISGFLQDQEDINGMISLQRNTYRAPFRSGSRVVTQHSNCSHGNSQNMTWKGDLAV